MPTKRTCRYEVVPELQAVGVKGSKAYGDDSSLYEAMGYIACMARKSGLTRKTAAAAPATPVEG